MSESNADFIKRVGAVCEAASGHSWYKQAQGYCGSFRTFRISAQLTDRGGMREQDAEFCTEARTALPEALERLAVAEAECDRLRTEAANKDAQLDDLETAVERLEDDLVKALGVHHD